ncbi:glycosyltransferase family 2 protein [Microbulbifer epialgicus]|uniref:Glycosyltransferase family 2 protein n=1 Tax=Microbulbifer epialgicus TaxID=393907 RepID=A0ABV4P682_9GAMM
MENNGFKAISSFSIVVPVHNESESIGPLIEEIFLALKKYPPLEVLIVDDGSTDDTVAEINSLLPKYPALGLISHSQCFGQSAGIVTGAREAQGDWLVFCDGDGQNNPAYIPLMLEALASNSTSNQPDIMLINCARTNRKSSRLKIACSYCANLIRRLVLHDGCTDSGCGLKLVNRKVFLAMPQFKGLHRFIPALVVMQGYRILEMEITDRNRTGGTSKYTNTSRAIVGIFDLAGVYWLSKRCSTPNPQNTVRIDSLATRKPENTRKKIGSRQS